MSITIEGFAGSAGAALIKATDLARALQTIRTKQGDKYTESSVRDVLAQQSLRATSFDNLFPAMFSIHSLDVTDLIEKSIKSNNLTNLEAIVIENAYKSTIRFFGKGNIPTLTTTALELLIKNLDSLVKQFNAESSQGTLNANSLKRLQQSLDTYKKSFNKPLYLIQYVEEAPGNIGSVKLASPSFAEGRRVINTTLKNFLDVEVKQANIGTSSLATDPTFLTKILANWGHTVGEVTDPDTAEIQGTILTGKLVSSLLSLGNALKPELALDISNNFIQSTGHINSVIKLTGHITAAGSGDVLKLVMSSGYFQGVRVQYGKENTGSLSSNERNWSILEVTKNNADLRKAVLQGLGLPDTATDAALVNALIKVSASPTYLEKLSRKALAPLIKNTLTSGIVDVTLLKSSKPVSKIFGSIQSGKPKPLTNTGSSKLQFRTIEGRFTSLTSLQNILNQSLTDQIRKNMGTGERTDVLNYRTGRFAGSAKVERMSASREGMITAFYSYMQNPYRTFSLGGKQEYPKTRDPKLLISRSIREIAGERVANRMRAVLV